MVNPRRLENCWSFFKMLIFNRNCNDIQVRKCFKISKPCEELIIRKNVL